MLLPTIGTPLSLIVPGCAMFGNTRLSINGGAVEDDSFLFPSGAVSELLNLGLCQNQLADWISGKAQNLAQGRCFIMCICLSLEHLSRIPYIKAPIGWIVLFQQGSWGLLSYRGVDGVILGVKQN